MSTPYIIGGVVALIIIIIIIVVVLNRKKECTSNTAKPIVSNTAPYSFTPLALPPGIPQAPSQPGLPLAPSVPVRSQPPKM